MNLGKEKKRLTLPQTVNSFWLWDRILTFGSYVWQILLDKCHRYHWNSGSTPTDGSTTLITHVTKVPGKQWGPRRDILWMNIMISLFRTLGESGGGSWRRKHRWEQKASASWRAWLRAREVQPAFLGQSYEKYLWNNYHVCNLDHDWADGGPLWSRERRLGKALRK